MIQEYLKIKVKQGRLYNSWLIDAPNPRVALEDLHLFIERDLFLNKMSLTNHPDYHLVTKDDAGNAKEIAIEQIRRLQQFFYKTPAIARYRVAVIYQADLMNLNAANSCLKLLEDTPKNGFIFLVTARAASIISTLRSRCAKINIKSDNALENSQLYLQVITYIADYPNFSARLAILEEFADKNKALWSEFACSILYLVSRITKKLLNCNIELHQLENRIFHKLVIDSPNCLVNKFYNINKIMNNTIDYDLNLKASTIELITELFSNVYQPKN